MLKNPNKVKTSILVSITLILVWILLTEIAFPGNKVFPSPSLILLAYFDLFTSYNFLTHLVSSVSVIYISFIISFAIIRLKFPLINLNSVFIKYLLQIPSFFLIVPGILIGVLLIYCFKDGFLIKLIYGVFINAVVIYQTILKYDESEIKNYIFSAKSLGVSDRIVRRKIIWKFLEPKIFCDIIDKHGYLWSTIIAFEFIQNSNGIGSMMRKALEFHDLSILIALIILLALIVLCGEKLLRLINDKYFFWK
jgi:ABC-type nitrate/sulfonate/bicarbonate transport system permease component